MAWFKCGGGGGTQFDTLSKGGMISYASGRYGVVDIGDLSNYKYVLVKMYTTANDMTYTDVNVFDTAKIIADEYEVYTAILSTVSSGSVQALIDVEAKITSTTIEATSYRGNWLDIYVDVYATNDELFPQ